MIKMPPSMPSKQQGLKRPLSFCLSSQYSPWAEWPWCSVWMFAPPLSSLRNRAPGPTHAPASAEPPSFYFPPVGYCVVSWIKPGQCDTCTRSWWLILQVLIPPLFGDLPPFLSYLIDLPFGTYWYYLESGSGLFLSFSSACLDLTSNS